ncbi:GNAT family N-acetyltransferase [Arsenicicoccus dermatophilus]|uniref:GNAT family N-acetyltransferase n=1 Tax=Arsenicicoccus dermatophilus TaxID=1076331 RepID=UPI0039170547
MSPAASPVQRHTVSWPLTDGRVTIRPALAGDVPAMWAYQQLPQTHPWVGRVVTSLDDARAVHAERTAPGCYRCVIEVGGQVVGDVGGRFERPCSLGPEVDAWDCTLGYVVHPREWGRGIASAAVRLVVPMLHDQLEVRRIVAKVFADNEPSTRVLLRNGFVLEGTERACVLGRDGRWLDDHTLAHLPSDPYDSLPSPRALSDEH